MATHRIYGALSFLGYTKEYEKVFAEHELDDELVAKCVDNMEFRKYLDEVIPKVGHRMKFIEQFKKTAVVLRPVTDPPNFDPSSSGPQEHSFEKENDDATAATMPTTFDKCYTLDETTYSAPASSGHDDGYNLKNEPAFEAADVFKSAFRKKFEENDEYLDEKEIQSIFSFATNKSLKTLDDILVSSSGNRNKQKVTLHYMIEGKMQKFNRKNLDRKHQQEKKLANHVTKLVTEYTANVKAAMADICLTDECLEVIHSQKKEAACSELRGQCSKLSLFPSALSNLECEIEKKFEKIRTKNVDKRLAFETKAKLHTSGCSSEYLEKIKKLIKKAFDMDELHTKNEEIRAETIKSVEDHLRDYKGDPSLLAKLLNSLDDHMTSTFEEYVTIFEMNLEEDEQKVKTVHLEITSLYNDEMEKLFQAKKSIPPARLFCMSEEIKKTAISKRSIELTEKQLKKLEDAMDQLYLKFEEKNVLLLDPSSSNDLAIGIDLGTTFSCVGVWSRRTGSVTIIENEDGEQITPSYVAFTPQGDCLVGEAAKEQATRNPQNTIFDVKRLIGRKFSDPIVQRDIKLWPFDVVPDENDQPKIKVGDQTYAPEEISARVLTHMKNIASAHLSADIVDAVITVPANFNDAQRQATRDAGEIAGLNVLKILNEPTAAAIAYNLHSSDKVKRNVFIFDLGGGTFDVAVLSMTRGDIEVKCVRGDTHLGGEDFDNTLVNFCTSHMKKTANIDLERDRESATPEKKMDCLTRLRRIRNECEKRKRNLSQNNVFTIEAHLDVIDTRPETNEPVNLDVPIERQQFEQMNSDLFQKCMKIVQEALLEAKLDKRDIHDVVLVGGSSRIPKIQEMLSEFFERKTLNKSVHPDEAVAVGAAVQAALLKGTRNVFLTDGSLLSLTEVATHSIGIKMSNRKMDVIISKNSVLPISNTKSYKTVRADQTQVVIKLFEGEKPMADDNRLLGKFVLTNIPPPTTKNGRESVDVVMTISEEGILKVTATCRRNRVSTDFKVVANTGRLSAEEKAKARNAMRVKGRLDSSMRQKFSLFSYFTKTSA